MKIGTSPGRWLVVCGHALLDLYRRLPLRINCSLALGLKPRGTANVDARVPVTISLVLSLTAVRQSGLVRS